MFDPSNGRLDSDSVNLGSNPSPPANVFKDLQLDQKELDTLSPQVRQNEAETDRTKAGTVGLRVLVCGGRNFNNYSRLYWTLDCIRDDEGGPFDCIITGGATGADHWAESWAWMGKITLLKFPAEWKKHGKAAGPIRNTRMIAEGKPDLVVAFPGGRGTADMVRRAKAAGVKVIEIAPAPFTGASP